MQSRQGRSALMSLRLAPELHRRIARMARQRGQSMSELVRELLEAAAASAAREEQAPRLFDRIAHLAGCVQGGRSDLSRRTGETFKSILRERRDRK